MNSSTQQALYHTLDHSVTGSYDKAPTQAKATQESHVAYLCTAAAVCAIQISGMHVVLMAIRTWCVTSEM